jgi:hypothetical protein
MTPKEYLAVLTQMSKTWEYKLKLVYSADDEGNHFQEVFYPPAIGNFDGQDFHPMTDADVDDPTFEVNAICIN